MEKRRHAHGRIWRGAQQQPGILGGGGGGAFTTATAKWRKRRTPSRSRFSRACASVYSVPVSMRSSCEVAGPLVAAVLAVVVKLQNRFFSSSFGGVLDSLNRFFSAVT